MIKQTILICSAILSLSACQATIIPIVTTDGTEESGSPEAEPSVQPIKSGVEVSEVQALPERLVLEVGKTGKATSSVKYVDNTSDSAVTWSSSDDTIASVDPVSGEITALKAGEVTIIASSTRNDTKRDGVQVSVKNSETNAAFITVSPSSLTLAPREMGVLTATTQLTDGTNSPNLSWTSSNSTVAIVKSNGSSATVTALKPGTAVIRVMADQDPTVAESITVTVTGESSGEPTEPAEDEAEQ